MAKTREKTGPGRPSEHPEGVTQPIGVTVPTRLIKAFDQWCRKRGSNRSKGITELLRRWYEGGKK